MGEYRIVWLPEAIEDLRRLRRYIEGAFASPELAQAIAQDLFDAAASLARLPGRFPRDAALRSVRVMPHRRYLVYYRVLEGAVEIVYIKHQLEDSILKARPRSARPATPEEPE